MSYGTRSSLVSRDWWDGWDVPSRIRDQHFGLGLSELDLLDAPSTTFHRGYFLRPRRQLSSGGLSEVRSDAEKFQVRLDVGHFAPEEIIIKTVDDQVVVTASHEEKIDEHGLISRQFTRRYVIPQGVEPDEVTSTLSADGILVVEAPRKRQQPALAANERAVPIQVQSTPSVTPKVAKEIPVQREQSSNTDKK